MNKDIRISTDYPDHPKTVKLYQKLGAEAIFAHIRLLCFVGKYRPKGKLTNMDMEDVENAAKWTGKPGEFVQTLIDLKLLDRSKNFLKVHDWRFHNLFATFADERSKKAKKAAAIRWKSNKGKEKQGMRRACAEHASSNAGSNAPSPSPSPSPSPNPISQSKKRKDPTRIGDLLNFDHSKFGKLFLTNFHQGLSILDFENLKIEFNSDKKMEYAISVIAQKYKGKMDKLKNPVGVLIELARQPGDYLTDEQYQEYKQRM